MTLEIELKLAFPETALSAILCHPLIATAPREGEPCVLDNTYFDTPTLALRAHGVAVRLRRQGTETLQTVKCAAASRGGLTRRPEWEQPWRGQFDFSLVTDPTTAALLEQVRHELDPLFVTRFRRDTRRLHPRDGTCVFVMIDVGTIEAHGRETPIHELELELAEGVEDDLIHLANELSRTLPLTPEDVSKAQRGYRLVAERPC